MEHHQLDPNRYVSYYVDQVGNGLPGYHGAPTMYGSGIGGIFRNLFRMVLPFMKRGFSIAKPHLKSAAKNIVSEVVANAMTRRASPEVEHQEGSGLMILSRRPKKRPPGLRRRPAPKKRRLTVKRTSVSQRRGKVRRSVPKQAKRILGSIF
jgi:hypothetical protein